MKRKSLGQIAFEGHGFGINTDYGWDQYVSKNPKWVKAWQESAKAVAREVRKRSMQREGRR